MVSQDFSPLFSLRFSYFLLSSLLSLAASTKTRTYNDFPSTKNSLQGKHITYFGATTLSQLSLTRNASGYIIDCVGIAPNVMEWLSRNYGFAYSILQLKKNLPFEDVGEIPGLISYVLKGDCDILVSATITPSRFNWLDFTYPTTYIPLGYLIPTAESSISLNSIFKPFSDEVWITLIGSTIFVILMLHLINWSLEKLTQINEMMLKDAGLYVVAVILHQHINWSLREVSVTRRVLIFWSVAALILTNFYTCLLISFLSSPNTYPMVSSITEVASRQDIQVVVDKGTNTEAILLNAERGLLKQLGDKIRKYPQSRCSNSSKCTDLVKSGYHAYFGGSSTYLSIAIYQDYKQSHSCNLQYGRDTLLSLTLPWGVHKNSPYLADINKGIIRMQETGLLDFWLKQIQPSDIRRCTKVENDGSVKNLSLHAMTGVFVILGVGYALAFFVLFIENVFWGLKSFEIEILEI